MSLGLSLGLTSRRGVGGIVPAWRSGFEGGAVPDGAATPVTIADLSAPGMAAPVFSITSDPSGAFSISDATLVLSTALAADATITLTATSGAITRERTLTVTLTSWVLATGAWDDAAAWNDAATWKDAA